MRAAEPHEVASPALPEQAADQLRYARWIDVGSHAGLGLLALLFAAYALGLTPPHVSHEELARLWGLPVGEYLRATGLPDGWGWLRLATEGDMSNLLGIVLLAGCSLPALLALLPAYLRRGDRTYALICAAEIAVIALAASGRISAGH